jgi:iturin family lipopeptide synthetase A
MEGQDLVGHCANLLPLRLRVSPDQPFSALLASAQRAMLDAYEHQGITFGTVLKALQLPRDVSRPPLIQVTFNVDPAMHGLNFAGLETEIVINPRTAYQFEHSLNIVAYSDRLRIECNYNTELFDQPTVVRWLQHYQEIARAVARKPDLMVGEIPLMTAEEQRRMVLEWNRTAAPYPACCIHELFEQEAGSHPDRIALSMAGRTLQYGELNEQANRLAHQLRAMGVGPDQPVGICTERSLEMVVGLLGILKAGGAYLPLDPAHPAERLKLQVADAGMRVAVGADEV